MNFISKYGYIKPNSWDSQSENGVLFSIQYHYLLRSSGNASNVFWRKLHIFNLLVENLNSNNGEFRTLPNDSNKRFSLDNMVATAGFSRRYDFKTLLDSLPLFRWYSVRPDNFVYLLCCKYPFLKYFLLWITSIFMIVSCLRAAPDRTSGPLLCYVKAEGLNMRFTWWLCKKVMPMTVVECFGIYYPEENHPINIEARKVFKRD